ncbi:hypothetical protein HMPREF9145_0410 [Segatella salivae F0493]|uniref:Uncharacterized protein n=1 Tax=Segatella salivae F0493 TaxID=1395125 RepID=U2LD29_9BACT|nr:hypothetical protein HMPREF9145_0410 [Segatella salivae F0493]
MRPKKNQITTPNQAFLKNRKIALFHRFLPIEIRLITGIIANRLRLTQIMILGD